METIEVVENGVVVAEGGNATLTSGSDYEDALEALEIYSNTTVVLEASHEYEHFFEFPEDFMTTLSSQLNPPDPSLLSLQSFEESNGTFTIEYTLTSYNSTHADTFLTLQSSYFAGDSASLIAPIQSVTVQRYDGAVDVVVENGVVAVLGSANSRLVNVTKEDYLQSI